MGIARSDIVTVPARIEQGLYRLRSDVVHFLQLGEVFFGIHMRDCLWVEKQFCSPVETGGFRPGYLPRISCWCAGKRSNRPCKAPMFHSSFVSVLAFGAAARLSCLRYDLLRLILAD